ncbi:hypothetical protein [Enterococcus gilvus]|uniref:hypothetical protein n=1 Tax=Enterococcus gilvus TaxID=160453 RepID=UPI001C8B3A98|nr:hypothetical protein [Enterococcus gilvus]MBX8935336.1 hypothetical protein [Enterococcus gilvus]
MSRWIALIGLLIMFIFVLLSDSFSKRKEAEYKNDERWQQIKLKASGIVLKFFNVIVGINCLAFVFAALFVAPSASISLVMVFRYAFYILALRYPFEYFALRYYDNKL